MHAPSAFRGFRSALAARDPGFDGLRRAARAGLGVPASAALGFSLGHGQGPLFAIFGATAMLIMVDFPGTPARRAVSYAGLTLSGAALIVLGTLVAPYPWAAVATTFAVGATATFSGVLSSSAAAAKRAILVPFVFPACTPPGPVGDRL
ncbi:FUSC family protein, partial [Mycolicibacterium insubricum]|nr:FUSC family protein [Mycolicibacterium insubricum]